LLEEFDDATSGEVKPEPERKPAQRQPQRQPAKR
jgi:hypothetical protein